MAEQQMVLGGLEALMAAAKAGMPELLRFVAAKIAEGMQEEREACALAVEDVRRKRCIGERKVGQATETYTAGHNVAVTACVAAIRARGK